MKLIAAVLFALQATLTVRTVLVALPVTVTDRDGERVTELTQDRFQVYDEGTLQATTLFHHGTGPITLGLVVDHSTSMQDNLPAVAAALTAFSAITNPDDELFVVNFNERVTLPLDAVGARFTNDPRAIAGVVGAIPARGRTALYDGVLVGLERVAGGRWDKRSLIVVSDGGDNASVHAYADVEALARRSDAVIYAIGLRGASHERSPRILKQLAEDSGGVAYFPATPQDVSRVFNEIVRELREQYTIGFSPDAPGGGFHRVLVTAVTPEGHPLRVRTRAGYLAPDGPR